MPQYTPAPGHVCGHCDGFPVVHIATGGRKLDGTLPTVTVICPACKGTGTLPARRTLAAVGR